MSKKIEKKDIKKGLLPYLLIGIIMLGVFYYFNVINSDKHEFTYDEFIKQLDDGKIKKMEITAKSNGYVYEVVGKLNNYKDDERFEVILPLSEQVMKKIVDAGDSHNFELIVHPDPEASEWIAVLVNFLPIAILIVFAFWFFNKQMAGNKSSLDFGKSRARLDNDSNKVTFKDVAGLKEEKEEVKELIDF